MTTQRKKPKALLAVGDRVHLFKRKRTALVKVVGTDSMVMLDRPLEGKVFWNVNDLVLVDPES